MHGRPEYTLGLLRIAAALAFLNFSGPALVGFFRYPDQFPVDAAYWFVRWVEVLAGSLLLLGLFTRQAALVLTLDVAFVYAYWHLPESLLPNSRPAIIISLLGFVCLHLAVSGPGRWSVDGLRQQLYDALKP